MLKYLYKVVVVMKKTDKKALKLVKKGFTIAEWASFPDEIKENEMLVAEVVKKISDLNTERIRILLMLNFLSLSFFAINFKPLYSKNTFSSPLLQPQ